MLMMMMKQNIVSDPLLKGTGFYIYQITVIISMSLKSSSTQSRKKKYVIPPSGDDL